MTKRGCGQEPKLTLRPGRCGAEAVAHVRPSPCLKDPLPSFFLPSFRTRVWQDLWAGFLGSKVWLPEKAVPPVSQRAHQSSDPDVHWQVSSRLLMVIVTECTPNGETLWVLLSGLGSAVRRLGPPAQEEAPAVLSADQLTNTWTSGPEDLHRPHQPLLLPPVRSSQPPSPEVFLDRKLHRRKSPGLACQSCPSDNHGSG